MALLVIALGLAIVPSSRGAITVGLNTDHPENADRRSFNACYLLRRNGGGGNLAVVSAGTGITLLEEDTGQRYIKVRVEGTGQEGFLSRLFLVGLPDPADTPAPAIADRPPETPAPPAQADEPSPAPSPDGFTPPRNRGRGARRWFLGRVPYGTLAEDEEDESPEDPTETTPEEPDDQAPLERAPRQVFYVFAPDVGKDTGYFAGLAFGRIGEMRSRILADVRNARQRAGLTGWIQIVPVLVSGPTDVMKVLEEGLVPEGLEDWQNVPMDEMVQNPGAIVGFCVVSHSGQDGPIFGKKQLSMESFLQARRTGAGKSGTFLDRLADRAVIRFAGCNTGHCHLYYHYGDHPARASVAHAVATILSAKQVLVYGRPNSGNADASSYYAFEAESAGGIARRLTGTINGAPRSDDDYMFYAPKEAETANRTVLKARSAGELAALEAWYSSRGIPASADGSSRTLRPNLGALGTVSRRQEPSRALSALVTSIDAAILESGDDPHARATDRDTLDAIGKHFPGEDNLNLSPTRIAQAIRDTRAVHDGALDLRDYRIWKTIYAPRTTSTVYAADLCSDHEHTAFLGDGDARP